MNPGDPAFSHILMRHVQFGQAPSPIMKPMNKKTLVMLQMAIRSIGFGHLVIPWKSSAQISISFGNITLCCVS